LILINLLFKGQIDRSDLQIVLRAVLQQETTDQQIQTVLSMLDKKRTGRIGLPEFWFVMESWIADNREAQGRSARTQQTPQVFFFLDSFVLFNPNTKSF